MTALDLEAAEHPSPAWLEAQRQAALTALGVVQAALRCGQVETARTKLLLVETYLHAIAPPLAPAEGGE